MDRLIKFLRDEGGVTVIEYSLIASITTLIITVALWGARGYMSQIFSAVVSVLQQGVSG